jgi:hypothetical protein
MLYRTYRAAKRIPGIGRLANSLLRVTRNFFWSRRPASSPAGASLPEDYIAFVKTGISGEGFTLVEVGAGDGRVLTQLAALYPAARFIGVDIQKAAVAEGNRYIAEQGIANVTLFCASCLEDASPWDCDYLISRTALIYLNRQEMDVFLAKRLPQVRRKLLLQEIVSLTGKTEVSHFFAHPLGEMAERAGKSAFTASTRLVAYGPWKRENQWSGADVTIKRDIAI